MATALITPYATLSFPNLFTPKPGPGGGDPKYSCALLFDAAAQKSKEFKKMQEAVIEAAKQKFGPTVNMNKLWLPFRDAGEKADQYQGYEEGVIVINPQSKQKPGIVNSRNQDVLLPEEVYAGQIVRAQVVAFPFDKAGKKGVSFGLNHIQIVKHDAPRIDGRVSASKAFDVIDEDEEADAPF
jgi:Protein of unknown function (DUF2815)